MGKCLKCNTYLPPGFVLEEDPQTGAPLPFAICQFCLEDKKTINIDGRYITKVDLKREYEVYLKKVREDNTILKQGVKGILGRDAEKLIH